MVIIPQSFKGWYKSNYPTLVFNPEWLNACIEYLQSTDSNCKNNNQLLIKSVETQLLCSDLSTSISLNSPTLISNSKIFKTLIPAANSTLEDKMIFKGGKKKGGVLLQVLEIQEISFSSSSLFEISKEKKEFNKLKSKGISTNPDGGRDMRLDDDDNEEQYNEIEEEEKKILTGNLGDKEPRFPRGSSKLVLSDGKNLVKAFELQKIKGLGLEEIKLGTKLLVFDVLFINGLLLLTPQNTIVKGFEIEELNFFKQFKIENFLREKLGLELLIPPEGDQLQEPQLRNLSPPPAQLNNNDEFEDEEDDDLKGIDFDLLQAQAIQQQQQSQSKSKSKPSLISSGRKEKARIRSEAEDFDLQEEEEEEEEEGWNVLNEIEQQQQRQQQQEQQGQQRLTKKIKKTNSTNSSNRVKNEPESSGNFAARSSKKKDNEVEVLELDSDDDDEDQNEYHQPLPSKRPAVAARGGGETSGGKVTVLEIDDSD
ncbi:hypothetical protein JCM3765_000182 [Sporobolomyces pararoseus]